MFISQQARYEIMCGFGNILSHFKKLCDSNVSSPHKTKTALYCIRKRKIKDIVEHTSGCVSLVLLDSVRRLLKTKISIFLCQKLRKNP